VFSLHFKSRHFLTAYTIEACFKEPPRVEHVWNVMAHAQKPDLVFQRNRRVHLNRRGRQFSRLLAAEVCASAVVMLDTPCSEVGRKTTGYPLHSNVSPSLPLPCVIVCHQVSTERCKTYTMSQLPESAQYIVYSDTSANEDNSFRNHIR